MLPVVSCFLRCDLYSVPEACKCCIVSLFNDTFLITQLNYIMWKCSQFGKVCKWCVRKWSKHDRQVDVILIHICRIIHCTDM